MPRRDVGVCVVIRGLGFGAPDTIRTYDLGFRKAGETAMGDGGVGHRDFTSFHRSLARALRFSFWLLPRCCPSEESNGTAQVARNHVDVALGGGQVGVSGE
jgi:hypothetical protein